MRSPQWTILRCPECKEHIYLGMGGQKNMLNHIGKTRCCEIQQKKSKEAKCQPQAMLMASFFWKKEPVCPTVVPPTLVHIAPPKPPPSYSALHTRESSTLSIQLDEQSASPLSRLRNISARLPDTIPLAVPSDCVAALAGDPREIVAIRQLEDPDEDLYEWLDKVLNGICGEFAKQNGVLPSAVRQGPMGLPGLCNTLQYFIDKGLASDMILETCINNLIDEAKKVYITVNVLEKPT